MPSCLRASGFTLIEMLTVVAVLIIFLGLMLSLSRHVRDRSAQQLTLGLLQQLDSLVAQYVDHNSGRLPLVTSVLANDVVEPSETALSLAARVNNQHCIQALRADYRAHQLDPAAAADPFEQLPLGVYDRHTLRDAWGSPLVFMPGQHPLVGMAPSRGGQDQYFFFSAGADRKYLTRHDNLYSYEMPRAE